MKKLFKLSCFLVMIISLLLLNPMHLMASSNYCYNLKASVGENSTSAGFNWHSSSDQTEFYLSVYSDMQEATKYDVEQHTFKKGMTNNQAETVFNERYVCQVNIENLEPSTRYYYQVRCGEYKSEICTFKTGNPNKVTFGVLCDTQASGSNFQYSNNLVKKLYSINSNINFFITAGDIVDRGGYEAEWNAHDQYMTDLNHQFLQATVPGNHELYHSALAQYVDASIYNEYFNNPKNGISARLNSSYYFKYNDTLFIMLDTMNRSNGDNQYDQQVEWFKNVVSNNPSKFIVVVTHPGCYSTGVYDSDASKMKSVWRNTFEEYGVDLAISGHEHVYARTYQIYQDKENTKSGVTYVIGGGAGAKTYTGKNDGFFAKVINGNNENPRGFYAGSIVEIVNDTLTFKFYSYTGELLDEFQLKSKANTDPNFSMDEFLDDVHVELNTTTFKNYVVWPDNAYGKVKEISVYVEHRDTTVSKFLGPGITNILVADGVPNRNYKYICTFTDYDGNEYEKVIEVINDTDALKPKDLVINIEETESGKYSATFDIDMNDHNVFTFLFLYVNGKQHKFNSTGSITFESDTEISADILEAELVYTFYGKTTREYIPNEEITYNITKLHTHEFVEGECECGEKDPDYVPHEHEFVDGECECGEVDPDYEEHVHKYVNGVCECGQKDPNGSNSGTSGCSMGTYIIAAMLPIALAFVFIKRKQ